MKTFKTKLDVITDYQDKDSGHIFKAIITPVNAKFKGIQVSIKSSCDECGNDCYILNNDEFSLVKNLDTAIQYAKNSIQQQIEDYIYDNHLEDEF